MKKNYHKEMLAELDEIEKKKLRPKLLLHSCCAPCSTYVLDLLAKHFEITVFFFNPNIYPEEEYFKRLEEQNKLIKEMASDCKLVEQDQESSLFYDAVKGYEDWGEGSERCDQCFRLRLGKTAQYAKANGFDYFTSTLTISPLKDAQKINKIGLELAEAYGIKFLNSDFKKNDGYKSSVDLSKKHKLYRQSYCGCVFSQKESEGGR